MKKTLSVLIAALLALGLFAACGDASSASVPPASTGSTPASQAAAAPSDSTSAPASDPVSTPASAPAPANAPEAVRIGGLKGPTTMGMVKLMADADAGETALNYQVEMAGAADVLVPKLVSGELDAAAIPANLASVLYNNTSGGVQVAAINTLGVLYVVETGEAIQSVEDLRGKTLYSTGKGTTPEFALNYILSQNGLDPTADLTIEYKTEATEIAALLADATDAVAVLPQPYATAVQMQNDRVRVALNLTEEWDKVSTDSTLVTGVLVIRTAFAQEYPEAVAQFIEDYRASIEWVTANTADAAALVAGYGIVEKAPVAEKALPACNIVCITGAELQQKLSGYLQVLHAANAQSVGGALPGEDFYLS